MYLKYILNIFVPNYLHNSYQTEITLQQIIPNIRDF